MAPPTEPALIDLEVQGTIPVGLSGRLVGIGPGSTGDGVVHGVHLHRGRALSYRSRWVITDAVARRLGAEPSPGPRHRGPDVVARNVIAFAGSILALGDSSIAYELTAHLETLRRVDLAGQCRGLAAFPKRDPATGDLHLLATATGGGQAHVVVSSGALTRTSRPITGSPGQIIDLAITRDCVVFVGEGFVGVASRDGEAHPRWITTGVDAPWIVHAHDADDAVVLFTLTPSLGRWTARATSATIRLEVLDRARCHSAHLHLSPAGEPPRYLWTTGDDSVRRHDLITATLARHTFSADQQPGDLVFVADHARPRDADGGWLVGFVHHTSADKTDLVVIDAADLANAAVATVRIPRRIARGLRSTWIPAATSTIQNKGDQR